VVAVAAALSLGAPPAVACACGIAIDASVSEESGLVIEDPGSERIVLSLDLSTDAGGRAAVVLPVPGKPSVEAVTGGDPLAYLDSVTAPAPGVGAQAGGGADTAAPPVDVIGRDTVGGYDVARLGSGDSRALDAWLERNGYALPAGAQPILGEYVDQGWRFVAIRLAPRTEGRLKPLTVSFPTEEPVYPMRLAQLGTEPVNLTLYTLADEERGVDGLDSTFAASVDELDPPPPAAFADLIVSGDELTRLEAVGVPPANFTADLAIEPIASPTDDDDPASTREEILAIVAALALLAFGTVAAIRKPR
jgi:hypothetical protein